MNKFFYLKIMILGLPILGNVTIYSQEKEKSMEARLGMSYLKIMDKDFSSMIHKGNLFAPSIGFTTETSKYQDITYYQFTKGDIYLPKANPGENTTSNVIGGSIDWIHIRKLKSKCNEKRCLSIGGVLNTSFLWHKREYPESNDPFYLFQSSLGPAIYYRILLKINNRQLISENLFTPAVICYSVYPSYGSYMPDNILKQDFDDISIKDYLLAGKILTFNKFQRLNFSSNIAYNLNDKLSLKLIYNWELINIIRTNNLTQANHTLSIALKMKLR